MTRKLIAAFVVATVGLGLSAQAMAGDWSRSGRHYGSYHSHDHNRDGRVDWRDHRHHGWDQGRHNGWWDRNRDGRVDWRDRRGHSGYHNGGYHHGGYHNGYNRVDRNHDGRVDGRERSFARRDRNRDGVLSYREWGR